MASRAETVVVEGIDVKSANSFVIFDLTTVDELSVQLVPVNGLATTALVVDLEVTLDRDNVAGASAWGGVPDGDVQFTSDNVAGGDVKTISAAFAAGRLRVSTVSSGSAGELKAVLHKRWME